MPTAPNSPQFKRHPISLFGYSLLDVVSSPIVKNASSAGPDTLLVAPPSANDVDANGGSVRRLVWAYTLFQTRLTNAAGMINGDHLQLVYKAEGGREVVLSEVTGILPQGTLLNILPNISFLMAPTDEGLFLRLIQGVPVPGSPILLDAVGSVFDVRGPARVAVDVTTDPVTLLENTSTSDVFLTQFDNNPNSAIYVSFFNFDDIDHTIHLLITDGVNTIDTTPPISFLAKGVSTFNIPALPPGWSATISLGEAVNTVTPRVVMGPSATNVDVARNDQAGAY